MAKKAPLSEYNRKRDFAKTAEPSGDAPARTGGNSFIVQKHDATRLHWDFRLEADGVLKSWAVTRGPSPDPDEKRLAVRTEDHPLAYGEFEGTIPQGEYGGGTVMLWDRGTWEPVKGKSARDLEKGHLHVILHGERMKGEWIIFRLRPRGKEKRENWLLRKVSDEYAQPGDVLVERGLTSVLTGRTMAEIAADAEGSHSLKGKKGAAFAAEMVSAAKRNARLAPKRRAKAARLPGFRPVQLATLVDAVPAGNGWMHEIKFDGYRALVAANGGEVKVFTRSGLDWTDKFAPLARHIAALGLRGALIDGEIVANGPDGNPSFSALQAVLRRGHGSQTDATPLVFHAFDLLELDGEDLTARPNLERKERLAALLAKAPPPIHFADHLIGAGERLFEAMCSAGQEGIIAKRIDAPYRGARTKSWVKVKCVRRQEFVVLGWKKSSARARPFASLLLGQVEDGTLTYKGNVGTGFNARSLEEVAGAMRPLATDNPPAEVPRAERRGVSWVKPELVAEVGFAEFTADGSVRHASFIGLRADKRAADVHPERPVPVAAAETAAQPLVKISNRARVIYPEAGLTKGDLADYYTAAAPLMLPVLAARPLSLVRCPQGRAKHCFFQKHDAGTFGPAVRHVPIREKDGELEDYIYLADAEGVLACVQMGAIEFHGWCCRIEDVEAPERMVFDLDPDEGLDFGDVKRAARDIRRRLEDLGLVSFPMVSGGKGVHVIVPLSPGHDWATHADFARRFAQALSLAEPDRYVATMSKAKRKGKIFVDWLRNQRGSTAILPYSARARPNAPVAAPVSWEELDGLDGAHPFTIRDAGVLIERAASKRLAGWGFAGQRLPAV